MGEQGLYNPFTGKTINLKQEKDILPMQTVSAKQGGTLMNKYQQGGAAPQQDMQQQVVQLVQAAMSGDQKASQTIEQIMQAAQQGDQQAVQLAQMIQEVAQQLQGQAQAAKQGAKLSYIHNLITGCPDGYEKHYYKKGGVMCAECIKKQQAAQQKDEIEKEKCGGKTKKKYFGGNVDSAKCGKKLAKGEEGMEIDPKQPVKKQPLKNNTPAKPQQQSQQKSQPAKPQPKSQPKSTAEEMRKKRAKELEKRTMSGFASGELREDKKGGKMKKCANGGELLAALQNAYKNMQNNKSYK